LSKSVTPALIRGDAFSQSDDPTSADEVQDKDDNADDQQYVDDSTAHVEGKGAEQPQDDEDDGNGREHGAFLFALM